MSGLVLTLTLASGKVEAWRRLCQELAGSRRPYYEVSRLRLGIKQERLALVENPLWSASITTIEADDIAFAIAGMIGSVLPFDAWYRERLEVMHNMSVARYDQFSLPVPPGTPDELLFEWTQPIRLVV